MRIGLLSDTHIPEVAAGLPSQLKEVFRDVDLILHAGDIYVPSVLDDLERFAPVLAAEGDDDYRETIKDKRVSKRHVLQFNGVTIWLTHERPMSWVGAEKVPDIIVHGHTHRDTMESNNGVLIVNPGSLTFPQYRHRLGSVGIINIDGGKPEVYIIKFP
ncbi:MAG: metallophosphoesterase family protein [Chloroflexi bacterium]|nr:metallophosphoesterase family protein [Chloroflexota bacterium]